MAKEGLELGVFALTMSVLGLLFPISAFPLGFIGGIVCSALGLIFGILQARKERSAWSTSAIVLACLGIIVNVTWFILLNAAFNEALNQYQQFQDSGALETLSELTELSQ